MNKKLVAVIIAVIIGLGGYYIWSNKYKSLYDGGDTGGIELVNGNSSGNIANAGYVVHYKNNIYGNINPGGQGLYKSGLKLKAPVRVTDDEGLYINIYEDTIYFVNYSEGRSIYKVDINGNNRTRLMSNKVDFLNLEDGWLYYIDVSGKGDICKLSIDGKTKKVIVEEKGCTNLLVKNGWIYYSIKNNIYKIDVNGNGKKKLANIRTASYTEDLEWRGNFDIHDTYIYYPGEDGSLYCSTLDGTNTTKLVSGKIESVNIYNNYLYYFNNSDKTIYRIKLEGQVKTEYIIGGGDYYNINIVSNEGVMFKDKAVPNGGVYMVYMDLSKEKK